MKPFTNMLRDEDGQGLVEYAIIIALVSVAAIVALKALSTKIVSSLNKSASLI